MALCGENGAGKSTLIKLLTGLYVPTDGHVEVAGEKVAFSTVKDFIARGIAVVHQEFSTIDGLTVAENIYLEDEPLTRFGFLDRKKLLADAGTLLQRLGIDLDPNAVLEGLSVAEKQMVEIAKALRADAKVNVATIAALDIFHAEDDPALQAQQARDVVAAGYDAIILSAVAGADQDLNLIFKAALAQGIAVICVDRRPREQGAYLSFVTASSTTIGQMSARWLAEYLDGQGRVWMLSGMQGSSPAIKAADHVEALTLGSCAAGTASPAFFETTGQALLSNDLLSEEVFGPLGILVRVADMEEMIAVAKHFKGQLTATLHMTDADQGDAAKLLPILERKAGRVLANGFPTGVEVADSMVHGGPYPAYTNFGATSVGTMAIRRFLRPVCYQNMAETLVP